MAGRPLIGVEVTRERDVLASGGIQQYRVLITNKDTVNTVKLRVTIPMTKYEGTRAFTSSGATSGNTASGAVGIADTAVILSANGGTTPAVLYTINSTLTLPTGQLYGSSTLFPVVQVYEQPSGTAVTENAISQKIMTSFVGDRSLSAFGTRANEKNSYIDEMQIATRLVMKSTSEVQAQALIDELDRGIAATPGAYDTYRSLNLIGGRMKVVNVTAAYTVQPDDGFIVNVSGANTITLPAASNDAIGRRLIIKSTAGIVTLAGGAVSNAVTSIAATKATEFISDGTTWNVVNVYV